ncbi:MAG: glycosyltransferase family 2 protein [Actinomycetota bacterium]
MSTGADPVTAHRLTTVVVSWNTRELLARCLASIRDHAAPGLDNEIVVVDNGSDDGSLEMLREQWPEVRVIANSTNVGFTKANNQALRSTGGRYVLLINADAWLAPGCLERLAAQLDADPRAAVAGPRLVYGDGRWQRWTAGREPGLRSVGGYLFLFDRFGHRWPSMAGIYLAKDVRTAFTPDWVSSACMLVRRSALEEVGLLDESLFAYMDDVDLCRRVRERGGRVWYVPEAECVHLMGRNVEGRPAASPQALLALNRYYARSHGRVALLGLRALEAVGFGLRAAAYGARGVALREQGATDSARAHWMHLRLSLERPNA